ncbi:MAG: hypothetical protein IOC82_02560 [Aestuariivirga sp.]|uniref:hypothetical protein n=1 Tax=Aestuariivirga sp. TaxID=2650926 RepID=UPI0025B9B12D|nr:hypothetical protein [Aestuariivirga sp.]MCA3559895.1 hypothetical protein [Aestuariivirga sp.]
MAPITSFFWKTPVPSLKAYLATKPFTLPATVTWTGADSDVVETLIAALDTLSEADRETLILEIARMMALADEPGQNALLAVVSNRVMFDAVEGGHNRALWVLMNEHANFQLAEDVRYNDEKRRGRMWQGFVVEKHKLVRKDRFSRDAFTVEIQRKFSTNHVHVDVFDRNRVTFDGKSHQLVQVAVYREGRPDDTLGFDGAGKLQRHLVKPVYEASLTYEPSEGVIEVVAGDKDVRVAMASMMGRTLMDIEFKGEILPAREYDLGILMEPFDFPTDARAPADQVVEKVQVRELRFKPLDRNGQRVTLECDGSGGDTIWDMADRHIDPAAQRRADWVITRARLVVKFAPHGKSRRARSLNLTITVPHGCNLKGMTPPERLVGEKYLRDWGILKGKPEAIDGAERS